VAHTLRLLGKHVLWLEICVLVNRQVIAQRICVAQGETKMTKDPVKRRATLNASVQPVGHIHTAHC